MRVVCDIETNGLHNPDKIWVICVKDIDTGERYEFVKPTEDKEQADSFARLASRVRLWIGHNFINFDYLVLCDRLPSTAIRPELIFDTLIASRLINYNIPGGHGLEAWGQRFGNHKPEITDWTKFSPEMIPRCHKDTDINEELFKLIEPHLDTYREALLLEFKVQHFCNEMSENGFNFNTPEAKKLHKEICNRLEDLDKDILTCFPPKTYCVKEVTPKATKHGTISKVDFRGIDDLTGFSVGSTFSRFDYRHFNPASPKQIVERMWEAGWKPVEKTVGHFKAEREKDETKLKNMKFYGWKVSEKNLATLPLEAPEGARKLAERLILDARRSTLEEWLTAVSEPENRIHGVFNGIGSWTHRMSHQKPNMANITAPPLPFKDKDNPTPVELVKHQYNVPFRALWTATKGKRLVGVDADGIQLRILAHYMNDDEFTKALVEGDSKNNTDVHSLNSLKLGLTYDWRDAAKTFIYAWLLGAGTGKVAEILQCDNKEAKYRVDTFVEGYPGLKELKKGRLKDDEVRGHFIGLDGRPVPYPQGQPHKILAGYLQNGEALIMKKAFVMWVERLRREKVDFWPVNFVHDEWQTEINDTDKEYHYVADVQIEAIVQAGKHFGLRCPLAGSKDDGYNWSDTH